MYMRVARIRTVQTTSLYPWPRFTWFTDSPFSKHPDEWGIKYSCKPPMFWGCSYWNFAYSQSLTYIHMLYKCVYLYIYTNFLSKHLRMSSYIRYTIILYSYKLQYFLSIRIFFYTTIAQQSNLRNLTLTQDFIIYISIFSIDPVISCLVFYSFHCRVQCRMRYFI